jgi:phenylpropionate dioxygenase-like ring-hydroxylating dioxygenase large terminal subunit
MPAQPSPALFEGFARVWTPVALSRQLRATAPLALELAGVGLVLFRDAAGAARALFDRCPHRGVALSLGKVHDGCIQCPFHGWRFDGAGQTTHVPWNPDAKLAQLSATPVPTRERGGLIWIYTAPGRDGEGEPAVPEELLRPGVHLCGEVIEWKCHWTRAMENMLDWPHLPFVHAGTIGRGMLRRPDARMDIDIEPRPWGAHTTIRIDGEPGQGALDLRWPNAMVLHAPFGGRTMAMMVACVPIGPRRTRMLLLTGRDFLRTRAVDWIFRAMNRRIAGEDRAVVESSDPPQIPLAAEERSVRTDALTLMFRKRFYAELAPPDQRSLPLAEGSPEQDERTGRP